MNGERGDGVHGIVSDAEAREKGTGESARWLEPWRAGAQQAAPLPILIRRGAGGDGMITAFSGMHGGLLNSAWPKYQAGPANGGRARGF